MTKEELLKVMQEEGSLPAVYNWNELLRFYAEHLAVASAKLAEEDMYPLIAVGGMIYQRCVEDLKERMGAGGIFEKLKARQEAEKKK